MELCNSDRQWASLIPVTGSNNKQIIKYAKQQQEPAKDPTKQTDKITIDQQQKWEEIQAAKTKEQVGVATIIEEKAALEERQLQ